MDVISDAVNSTAVIVEGLGKKSEEIGQIVVLITDIANQTNLLALNAAIEAARAGEQGKGFAVVAEEVRKLAEESSQAACRISDLIKEMQAGAGNAVKAMQAGTREVSNGIEVVAKAGNAFREITEAVATVNTQIQEVSAASEEMAASAGTAYDSVQETAHAAEKNSRYAQDISRLTVEQLQSIETMNQSVAELNQVVGELEQSIQYFKV
jgi:methyl-accepting chemotaxis protein